ncbi:MAG: response regulator [Deltaproteobacteria bacterium]|nr:MAG: response regulator [Deltaproteobacteria bacterium]
MPAALKPDVLIVDDSLTVRMDLAHAFETAGCASTVCATAAAARSALERTSYALIVLDVLLPDTSGIELLAEVKHAPHMAAIPVILLSTEADARDRVRGLGTGADEYVGKPYDLAYVVSRGTELMRRTAGAADAASAADSTADGLAPKRILAIDDSPTYLYALAGRLREEGYEVVLARSGEEALEVLAAQPVDWVVMLTAMEEREAMIDGITAGADDYVTKSADFAVLKARVGAKLRRKQIEDENRIIRERLLRKEMEAAEARAARALAETRGALLADLEGQHAALARATAQEREAHEALKRAQSQLVQSEKLAALGQMVAGVAHEINNPLSFVVNDMAVLQRDVVAVRELVGLYRQAATAAGGDGPELQRRIRAADERIDVDHTLGGLDRLLLRAREGLRRIEGIVKDLRGFARLDEGERNEADLNAGVVSTVNIVRERAAKRNIAIALELGRLPPVICHGAKINQVVLNLIANAIDACADGGSVTVRTACEQGGIAIRVIDSGKGIDPEIRGRIFDPFFTTKPIGEGTGLGLSISYGIVQEHGGTIDVDSTPGCGACFTLRLPIGADAERRSRPGGATEGAAAPR